MAICTSPELFCTCCISLELSFTSLLWLLERSFEVTDQCLQDGPAWNYSCRMFLSVSYEQCSNLLNPLRKVEW